MSVTDIFVHLQPDDEPRISRADLPNDWRAIHVKENVTLLMGRNEALRLAALIAEAFPGEPEPLPQAFVESAAALIDRHRELVDLDLEIKPTPQPARDGDTF